MLQYSTASETAAVIQNFPSGAENFEPINTSSRNWIKYMLNGTTYLTTLDASQTFPMRPYGDGEIVAWVEIPLPEHNTRLATYIGIACFGVTLIPYRLLRR